MKRLQDFFFSVSPFCLSVSSYREPLTVVKNNTRSYFLSKSGSPTMAAPLPHDN